jgi:hypothetical protein
MCGRIQEKPRVCGNCQRIRRLSQWDLKNLYRAVEEGVVPLLRWADSLLRRSYRCGRERCRVHVLDEACSFWEPIEEADTSGSA